MNYELIYFTLNEPYSFSNDFTYISIFFLILLVGTVGIGVDKYKKDNQSSILSIFSFGVFCLLIILLFMQSNMLEYKQYINLVKKIENKQYKIIEGKIKSFKPISKFDKKEEEFSVENVFFKYSPHGSLKTFNSVKGQNKSGNPLEEGLPVRIMYYFDENWNTNLILKLEIDSEGI